MLRSNTLFYGNRAEKELSMSDSDLQLASWPHWALNPRGDTGIKEWLVGERKRLASNIPGGLDPSRVTHSQVIRTIDEIIREIREGHPAPT